MRRKTMVQMGAGLLVAVFLAASVPMAAHHKEEHGGGQGTADWPPGAHGPFVLKDILTDPITSFDGTPLETTVFVPDLSALPKNVRAPVVLVSEGYAGSCAAFILRAAGEPCLPASDSDEIYNGLRRVNIKSLVEAGYAVAYVNVRGTGASGGCYDHGGPDQQMDMVAVVENLAARDWSNGRVAMYGHSWGGWTPFMAAVHAPDALRTIVASGIITNPYLFSYTPEGAVLGGVNSIFFNSLGTFGFAPPLGGGVERGAAAYVDVFAERVCPEVLKTLTEAQVGQKTGIRNGEFWETRRLAKDFGTVTASVLVAHGINDGHHFQYDTVWQALPDDIDKRMILGQWGHELPPSSFLNNATFADDWEEDILFPWLDHYLKGRGNGSDLRLGTVDYQAQGSNEWRTSTVWPPADRTEEVLYFTPDGLHPEPDGGSWSFVAYNSPPTATCPVSAGVDAVVFTTPPARERVVLAGNPMAYLQTTSTLPGGTLTVDMFVTPPGGTCQFAGGFDDDFMWGSADLRFHKGGYTPEAFPFLPTERPTPVRIDMTGHAVVVPVGSTLLVKVSGGGEQGVGDSAFAPVLTVHGGTDDQASHLVLPLVEGSFGGASPTVTYADRPF